MTTPPRQHPETRTKKKSLSSKPSTNHRQPNFLRSLLIESAFACRRSDHAVLKHVPACPNNRRAYYVEKNNLSVDIPSEHGRALLISHGIQR